ncbi:hypothetical protein DLAC_04536 [Tieghemostelium lacteum]|uniref:Transmembrane protein n=1 Tax=Tieghemostelium lacteum TaxID=361077 RepID=A0A151ZJR3_TIELA|nr:hypothetical protein DLAC_04536 [Tieghemostelium lacteum]|eukprot:KYQ94242.1 hypothetical protein DLAC_04536 [Tieghemostelium lacteum]
MKHIGKLTTFFAIVFTCAIIGMNFYAFMPNTPWYTITITFLQSFTFTGHLTRSGIDSNNVNGNTENNEPWNGDSKTKDTLFESFALIIVSFVLSCIVLLLILVGLLKHLHKGSRKLLFVLTILMFIANSLSTILFIRINKAFCDDVSDGLDLPGGIKSEIDGTSMCSSFKGDSPSALAGRTWGPGIGWILTLVASICSLIMVILGHRILHAKKFGYHALSNF